MTIDSAVDALKFSIDIPQRQIDVVLAEPSHISKFLFRYRPGDSRGDAHYHHSVGNLQSRGNDGSGRDKALAAHPGFSQQDSAHADERATAHESAMHDRSMTDRDIIFDHVLDAGVAMNDSAVLHVNPPADRDRGHIATHDGVEPEARRFSDAHIAGDRAVVGEKISVLSSREQCHRRKS